MKGAASTSLVILVVAMALSVSRRGDAHDARGIIQQEMHSASPQLAAALAATPSADVNTRSVLNNLRLWPVPRILTVCFLSGSSVLRARITQSMRRVWPLEQLTNGLLKLDPASFSTTPDCGPNPNADIRIDFKAGDGYWSYVGIESRQHTPSMNLEGFTETVPALTELDRLVGHETGHALGLEHEHQSPVAPDCGWNFPYLWTHYVWTSDADMHANFNKLTDFLQDNQHAYIFSTYDQKSLMHYDFEPPAFLQGTNSKCYIQRNFSPSTQDKNAISVAYSASLLASQGQMRDAAPMLTQKFSTPQFQQLRQLLQNKVSLLP